MKKSGIIIALVLACLSLAAWAGALAVARAGGLEQPTAGAGAWASSPTAGEQRADGALPTAQSHATPPPGVALTGPDCVGCHARSARGGGARSHVGAAGRGERVSCVDCHGSDHAAIVAAHGQVAASVCGRCHPQEFGI